MDSTKFQAIKLIWNPEKPRCDDLGHFEQLKQKAKKNEFRKSSFSRWKLPFRWWIYINLIHILVHILVHICAISHEKNLHEYPMKSPCFMVKSCFFSTISLGVPNPPRLPCRRAPHRPSCLVLHLPLDREMSKNQLGMSLWRYH